MVLRKDAINKAIIYGVNDRLAALTLFRKGLGLRSIAEIIGTSNVLVLYWIRNIGRFVQEAILSRQFASSEGIDIIEISSKDLIEKLKLILRP